MRSSELLVECGLIEGSPPPGDRNCPSVAGQFLLVLDKDAPALFAGAPINRTPVYGAKDGLNGDRLEFDVASNSRHDGCVNTDKVWLNDLQIKCEPASLADRDVVV
jgi:hypothetical protein